MNAARAALPDAMAIELAEYVDIFHLLLVKTLYNRELLEKIHKMPFGRWHEEEFEANLVIAEAHNCAKNTTEAELAYKKALELAKNIHSHQTQLETSLYFLR